MTYSYDDLLDAYRAIGVEKGRSVYVTSDLGRLRAYEDPAKEAVLEAHLGALAELVGPEGTIAVPASSINLCNTEIPFDPQSTPAYRVGAFSEYVRTRADSCRSFHPFVSYAAIGRHAAEITARAARHAYGPETPEARLIDLDALSISIGLHPRLTCSTVHHVEMVMGVPYRYAKEFIHPVVRGGAVVREPFYLYVWYRDIGLKRDGNRRIFAVLDDKLPIASATLGRGTIYGYSMAAFYKETVKLFSDDLYIWCRQPPARRPYRV